MSRQTKVRKETVILRQLYVSVTFRTMNKTTIVVVRNYTSHSKHKQKLGIQFYNVLGIPDSILKPNLYIHMHIDV